MSVLINKVLKKYFHLNPVYSQEGEDTILERIFDGKNNGFFVDVGAHHPKRFSNTYLLYLKGWRGINIEPMPGIKKKFDRIRPKDINLALGISEKARELTYHIFNETALNTFSEKEATIKDGSNNGKYHLLKKLKIATLPLAEVLKKYLPAKQEIDFMTIDVEGLDLEVIKSNDWNKYRPKIVLTEDLNRYYFEDMEKSEIYQLMKENGYKLLTKTYNTLFFEDAQ